MGNAELHGVVVPVITPVDDAGDVDEAAFRKVIRRLIDHRVHGIFVGGSAGEGPLLTAAQWHRMAEIAIGEVRADLPLLGGVMETSARRALEKIKALRDMGYRYLVLTPTFYIAVRTASEHLRLFGEAKEATADMELIAYNIPQCTGSSLAVDTVCEMARRGWIRCCKESSGDWEYLNGLLQRAPAVGLTVLAGDEKTAGEALLSGAGGIVPVCANYDPATFLRLYDAARARPRRGGQTHDQSRGAAGVPAPLGTVLAVGDQVRALRPWDRLRQAALAFGTGRPATQGQDRCPHRGRQAQQVKPQPPARRNP